MKQQMHRASRIVLTGVTCAAATAGLALAEPDAQLATKTVALSHTAGFGVDLSEHFVLFGRPIIAESGDVAFEALLDRSSFGPEMDTGVWAHDGEALRLVAWEGHPSGDFASFEPPQLTDGGDVVLVTENLDRQESAWQEIDGVLTRIVSEGDDIPPGGGDGGFEGFADTPAIGGHFLSFHTDDAGPSYFPMWTTRWDAVELVIPKGWRLPAFGGWEGGEVRDLVADDNSRHAFIVRNISPDGLAYAGIWRETSSFVETIALTEDLDPLDAFLEFRRFRWPSFEGGTSAFYADLKHLDTDDDWQGAYAFRDGALQRLALRHGEAPGISGAEISFLGHPLATDAGGVSFTAALAAGDEIDESNNAAVWRGMPGDLQVLAREGETIPGLPADVVIRDFQSVAVSDDHAALYVTLFGYTVGDNDRALLLIDPDGDKHLVARVGDKFDVAGDGSDPRSIKSIGLLPADPERGRSPINSSGTIAFTLEFYDGTSGVFTARLLPTPCVGDVDGDGDTGQADLGLLLATYELDPDDPLFNGDADLDGDGFVGQPDLGILLADFGCLGQG